MAADDDAGWEVFDDDVGRVLAVVAHPDDLEYGAAAAVARWTDAGHHVAYTLVTRGEAGIDGVPPPECGPLRAAEQVASAAVVGVGDVEFLDHPDGVVVHDLALRRDLTAAIRRHRPDTLVTLNHHATWGTASARNSADHRAVGAALLDAVMDAGNRWIFPGVGGERHAAKRVLVAGSPHVTHGIDVTGHVDAAVASLAEHRAYLDGLGDHPMADPQVLRWWLADAGARIGTDAAVGVEVIRF